MVPAAVAAAGWAPLLAAVVAAFVFSLAFVLWHRSVVAGETRKTATAAATVALAVTLLSSVLVPVDVFLVSVSKNRNGTYRAWAANPHERQLVSSAVELAYLVAAAVVLFVAFAFVPLALFYSLGKTWNASARQSNDEEAYSTRCWRAVLWTLLVLAVLLALTGVGAIVGSGNVGDRLKESFVFVVECMGLLGAALMCVYTAYGMSAMPLSMLLNTASEGSIRAERDAVLVELALIEEQLHAIESRYQGREQSIPRFEVIRTDRLEQRVRILQRTKRNLDQRDKGLCNRLMACCRPFQLLFGAFFLAVGALIFVSLLFENVDRTLHSEGASSGYEVVNGTMPNPADTILVYSQVLFPLDFALYSLMVVYLIFCSAMGLKTVGLGFYGVKPNRTLPEALLLMSEVLIFLLLAINTLMFTVVPDYTTYGNQNYVLNVTVGNETISKIMPCTHDAVDGRASANALLSAAGNVSDPCDTSRVATALTHVGTSWRAFAVASYWINWLFLLSVLAFAVFSSCQAILARRRSVATDADDQQGLLDDGSAAPPEYQPTSGGDGQARPPPYNPFQEVE